MPFTSACKHFGRRRGIFFQNTRKKASVVSIQRELLLLIKSSPIHNNKQVLVTHCHLRNKIVKQIVAWWKSIVQHLCVCEEHSRMLDIYVFDTNVCRMENCPLLLFKHDTLCWSIETLWKLFFPKRQNMCQTTLPFPLHLWMLLFYEFYQARYIFISNWFLCIISISWTKYWI